MAHYLLASHGNLASGIRNSIEMLMGIPERVSVIDAYIDESDYLIELNKFLDSLTQNDLAVIFTDLYGGSVNQKVMIEVLKRNHPNIHIITGMNLAIVLAVLLEKDNITEKRIQELIFECQVKLVTPKSKQTSENDLETFFEK